MPFYRPFAAVLAVAAFAVPAAAQTPYKNGFTLQSDTGDFVLKLSGHTHVDGRFLCRR